MPVPVSTKSSPYLKKKGATTTKEDEDLCQEIIGKMVDYIYRDGTYKMAEIAIHLPNYFQAIMKSMESADGACVSRDVELTKKEAKKAMGYYKKAKNMMTQPATLQEWVDEAKKVFGSVTIL